MRLTEIAHQKILRYCPNPLLAIDATIGNGYDTQFLQKILSPQGKLWGFDIQESAMNITSEKIYGDPRIHLIKDTHEKLNYYLAEYQGKVDLIMYNLGYLPNGDKTLTTLKNSTIHSVRQALTLLRTRGVLSILAYPGHPQGKEEAEFLKEFVDTQEITAIDFSPSPNMSVNKNAPFLYLGIKE